MNFKQSVLSINYMEVVIILKARGLATIFTASIMITCLSLGGAIAFGNETDDATVAEKYINMTEVTSTNQVNAIAKVVDISINENEAIRVGVTEDYLNVNYTNIETDAKLSVVNNDSDELIDVKSIVDNLEVAKNELEKEKELKAKKEADARIAKAKADLAKRNYTTSRTQGGLLDISNPDPNYTGKAIKITGADRDMLERLVMGEAGGQGFEGAALVAQCIRDMYILGGYNDINTLRINCKYSGSIKKEPNQDVLDAVSYIFDQGGYVVKHRILYFYAPKYVYSGWHESQNNIINHGGHKFFDRWS